ncbi:MAG: hypothetical protein QOG62_2474 [Thermoleophilaceae bacterium]|nr:hypothetical protein [Thermoleophilaceae bacterium]
MRQVQNRTIIRAGVALLLLLLPQGALANGGGTYRVYSCDAAPDRSTAGWVAHNVDSMDADRLCPWQGDVKRGLIARNKAEDGRVGQGATANLTFTAPAGTELWGMDYAWDGYRKTENWTIGLAADGQWLTGCRANDGQGECNVGRNGTEARHVGLAGHATVRIEATCGDKDGCATNNSGDVAQAGLRARAAFAWTVIELRDNFDPGVSEVAGGLLSSGWIRGPQDARFTSNDNTGISTTRMLVDGIVRFETTRPCTYTRPIPCSTEPAGAAYGINTGELSDGHHQVELQAVDAAGNMGHETRTINVDNNAPVASFDARDRGNPSQVTVSASDTASGVAGGQIEMRPLGGSTWRQIPTSVESTRLMGTLPTEDLEEGTYEFRASIADHAGNSTLVDRMYDGTKAEFVVPGSTRMTAALAGKHGREVQSKRVRYGRSARASGTLRTLSGAAVPTAPVTVMARRRSSGADWEVEGHVMTDGDGRFSYQLPVGPSRDLRFDYAGSEHHLGSSATVGVSVPATTSLKPSRRRVDGGKSVVFSGRVRGGPVPAAGKLVDLQAYYRGRWRTFALPRTDTRGRWKRRYKFGATSSLVRYRFRARVPREVGYPYLPGRSKTVRVLVDGRK